MTPARILESTRRFVVLSALLMGLPAAAKDVVVYQGESSSIAISRVVLATETDIANLEAVDLEALLQAASPGLVGPGSITACSSAETSDLATVKAAVEQANADLEFMDYVAAGTSFTAARAAVLCLGEPLDIELVGQLHFLEGIAHLGQSDKPSAWESFRQARLYNPDLSWDESFAPEGKPTFLAAVAELAATAPQSLYFIPAPTEGSIIIDGKAVTAGITRIELHQGTHLLQWADEPFRSAALELVAGPAPVLVSSKDIPEDLLAWAKEADPEKHAAIRATLGGLESSTGVIYISSPHGIWQTQLGLDSWTQLEGTTEGAIAKAMMAKNMEDALLHESARQSTTIRRVGVSFIAAGTAVTVVGGLMAYEGYKDAYAAFESLVDSDDDTQFKEGLEGSYQEELTGNYNDGKQFRDQGLIIAASGTAFALGGMVIRHQSMSLGPIIGPAGTVGLRLSFGPR